MTERLAHRGPDAGAVVRIGPVAFGHRRLSIIDLSLAANQPMSDATGRHWIVFNGEIYNFKELRADLANAGARFRTDSDTEVILESYRKWGVDCVQRLNGMFAFALWDIQRQRLLLARDRLGEKPLYYATLGDGGLLFASETKALRAHPSIGDAIEPQALGHYLSLNYTLTDASMLRDVRQLPPAHVLICEPGRTPRLRQYWDLAENFRNKRRFRSEAAARDELAALIDDSVRLRLVSDVPLGAFLSGGIDSSAVVAAMSSLRTPSSNKTFSIGFRERTYSELDAARTVASHLAVDHRDRIVDVDMARDLERIVYFADEPLADTSIIPTFHLAGFARSAVTVCLSGDGGDETFAGYETYLADKLRRSTAFLPRWLTRSMAGIARSMQPISFDKVGFDYKLRKFLQGHAMSAERAHCFWRTIFDRDGKRALLNPDWQKAVGEADPYDLLRARFAEVDGCDFIDQAMYVDIKSWLPNDILAKVDRATMAHSLESRAPFLDHRLVEFAASLPVEWKLKGWRTKHLLKESQRARLPASIINRRKAGFNAPISHWLDGNFAELAQAATRDPVMDEWFKADAIDRLWQDHIARRCDNGLELFGLTCLSTWLRLTRENQSKFRPASAKPLEIAESSDASSTPLGQTTAHGA